MVFVAGKMLECEVIAGKQKVITLLQPLMVMLSCVLYVVMQLCMCMDRL